MEGKGQIKAYHFEEGDKMTYNVNRNGSLTLNYLVKDPVSKLANSPLVLAEKKAYWGFELEEAIELFKEYVAKKEGRYEYPLDLVIEF